MQGWKLAPAERRRFAWLAAGGVVYVLPILLADRYYQDDLARSLYGATGWEGDGRPLVSWLMQLLSGGYATIADLAPLPMLLGLAALAYALTLYARRAFPALRHSALATLVLGLVLAHPFAMANLSYRFDCLSMLLALALCFVLYALPAEQGGPVLAAAGAVLSLLVMGLYQPAAGMFLVLAGIWLVFWLTGILGSDAPLRPQLPALWAEIWRLGGVAAGALFYLAVIAPQFVSQEDWRQQASALVDGPAALFTNILRGAYYIRETLRALPPAYRLVLGVTGAGAVVVAMVQFWRRSHTGLLRRLLGCAVIAAAPLGVLLASYLPLVFLQDMACTARMFLAFGGCLLLIGLLWLRALPARRRAIAAVLLGGCLFAQTCYLYAYGSALKSQKAYETYLVTQIAHDCETINADQSFRQLSFVGQAPTARQVRTLTDNYPFFAELIQPCFTNSTWIGGAWVYHYLQYDLEITALTDEDQAVCVTEVPVLVNDLYNCFTNGDKILV